MMDPATMTRRPAASPRYFAVRATASLKAVMPAIFAEFKGYAERLERHFRDMQDMEFTVERGRLWMLQTRAGKRTARAALKLAVEEAMTHAEAMAAGAPVITSNVSALPEVAGDAALLVEPYHLEDLAAAIQSILSDPALRAALIKKGLERSKNFSWQKTSENILKELKILENV